MRKGRITGIILAIFVAFLFSCQKDSGNRPAADSIMTIPEGFPAIAFPEGNEYTPERWALGKKLFYDKALSLNQTVSCGSCHKPEFAFSDNIPLSLGDNNSVGRSNAPTLSNIAYHPYYTRAGGVPTLEMHILVPIQEHDEFNFNIVDIVDRLKEVQEYKVASRDCYQRELDPYVITRAIANFERSFISGNSDFDKYYYQGRAEALNATEKRGMDLFFSPKTNCSSCHSGINFTNYAFENNGLYINYADSGRMRLTELEEDRALFKVPTLRNISLTGPYMHDGSINTLEEAIEHYNSGGKEHINKSQLIKPLNLKAQERSDLIAFLNSLTDKEFVSNQNLRE